MVGFKVLARFGVEAFTISACSAGSLLLAGRLSKICRRPAHVMNIALKIGMPGELFCLLQYGSLAPRLNHSSLMISDGAEGTASETPSVTYNAELNLGKRRNAAFAVILRMPLPCIGQ